jgi:pilus assembly protein CpaF
MQEIFSFAREGVGPNGQVLGSFRATGVRPRFLAQLRPMGLEVPASYFDSQAL